MTGEAAVDLILRRDPGNIQALVEKGDFRTRAGDERTAAAFYRSALREAAAAAPLPLELRPHIERAQGAMARAARAFEDHLERSLAAAGFPPRERPPRFRDSIEILTGKREVKLQLQRPGGYLYPDLPQRRYYERGEFAWAAAIEQMADVMRGELSTWLESGQDCFTPYMVSDPNRPRHEAHGLIDNPDWSTLYLWQDGRPVEEHIAHCHQTF